MDSYCVQSPLLLATPEGVGRVCYLRKLLLAARKWVYVFFECHLIRNLFFFELVLDVLCNLFGILPCRAIAEPSAPKRSVSISPL